MVLMLAIIIATTKPWGYFIKNLPLNKRGEGVVWFFYLSKTMLFLSYLSLPLESE